MNPLLINVVFAKEIPVNRNKNYLPAYVKYKLLILF